MKEEPLISKHDVAKCRVSVSHKGSFSPGVKTRQYPLIGGGLGDKTGLKVVEKRKIFYCYCQSNHDSLVVQFVV